MKNGFIAETQREESHEDCPVMLLRRRLGRIFTGQRYRTKLIHLSRALPEKRPQYEQRHEKVILQHDNVWPHVATPVKTYLETLKCEVLPHLPYSSDVAPFDYYLFRSMAHGLADQQFRSHEDI